MKKPASILVLVVVLVGLCGLAIAAYAQSIKGDIQFDFKNFAKDQYPVGMLNYEGLLVYANDQGVITENQLGDFKTKPLNFTLNIETPTQNLNCTTIDNYDANQTYHITATYNPQNQTVNCTITQ